MKIIPIKSKTKKLYFSKDETPLWARCSKCGELNIVSDIKVSNCNNCKIEIDSYMRELTDTEINERIIFF